MPENLLSVFEQMHDQFISATELMLFIVLCIADPIPQRAQCGCDQQCDQASLPADGQYCPSYSPQQRETRVVNNNHWKKISVERVDPLNTSAALFEAKFSAKLHKTVINLHQFHHIPCHSSVLADTEE